MLDPQSHTNQFQPLIYVVDDDEASLELMRYVMASVDLDMVGLNSAQEFLNSYRQGRPGCLLLDMRMPGMSGLELQEEMKLRRIDIPIVFVTGHGETQAAVRAMKNGAFDFIEKPINIQAIIEVVFKAVDRSRFQADERANLDQLEIQLDRLTPREKEVLERLIDGKRNKQIAFDLGISERTVEVHRSRVMEKLDATSIATLVQKIIGPSKQTENP